MTIINDDKDLYLINKENKNLYISINDIIIDKEISLWGNYIFYI